MPLDPAAVLALAPTCAPAVAPTTMLAIAQVESGLNPFAIGVNGPRAERVSTHSRAEAIRTAEALIAAGRNVDLGLAQINVRNLSWLGLSVAQAFDPCRNLAASARVLADGYRRAAPAPGAEQQGLRTALSFYNTGHPERGFRNGYVTKVTAAAARLSPAVAGAPELATPSEQPRAWDVFGRARQAATSFVISPTIGAQP